MEMILRNDCLYPKKAYLCASKSPPSLHGSKWVWFNQQNFYSMPVKIRLQRKGRKKRPFYHIVIADGRSPRDGRFIEKIGIYNPMTNPATIDLDRDKAYDWLTKGAQPTDTVRAILRFKGVLYKKHLMRGVKKGAISIEEADQKLADWISEKDAKIDARKAKVAEEKRAYHATMSGTPPVIKEEVVEIPAVEVAEAVEEGAEAVVEAAEEVVEAATETVEEVVAEAPAAEEAVEAAAEEVVEAAEEAVEEVAEEAVAEASEEATEAGDTPADEEKGDA